MVEALLAQYRLFHWHLEFPEVFSRGGFDLVLGNPPWDTLSPDEGVLLHVRPAVREQDETDSARSSRDLLETRRSPKSGAGRLPRRFVLRGARVQERRPLRLFASGNLGKGDFNIYRMFVETALAITGPDGFTAQIVPENLANGANAAAIRQEWSSPSPRPPL